MKSLDSFKEQNVLVIDDLMINKLEDYWSRI